MYSFKCSSFLQRGEICEERKEIISVSYFPGNLFEFSKLRDGLVYYVVYYMVNI